MEKIKQIVQRLKKSIPIKALAVRNGREEDISITDLVIGDIIILEESQMVPADVKILAKYDAEDSDDSHASAANQIGSQFLAQAHQSNEKHARTDISPRKDEQVSANDSLSILTVDRYIATGDSFAVEKSVGDTVFFTCEVNKGKAYGVVTAQIKDTIVGKFLRPSSLIVKIWHCFENAHLAWIVFWIFLIWNDSDASSNNFRKSLDICALLSIITLFNIFVFTKTLPRTRLLGFKEGCM